MFRYFAQISDLSTVKKLGLPDTSSECKRTHIQAYSRINGKSRNDIEYFRFTL